MMIIAETLEMSARQRYWTPELTKGMTAAAAILTFSVGWGCSALLYWMRKTRTATIVNLGTAASVGLFLVLAKLGVIL
ncbi:hypothetical protein Poly59_06360 [Rubripirellula reticaptiva]|uniref:Uncharacterized protein n=2 Tax=Rubripirellula reticaptiva TaxID=2528013 RepID=A0A5C6F8J7_9BACT|nr:hypothetical protein Poly59_06360 [Rubripirellula reticaptiva]